MNAARAHDGDQVDPRVQRTREVVVAATAELLSEAGFERITIDGIAERSGVARSTIYRNWPDRADLLIEAFEAICAFPAPPGTGSLREDLTTVGFEIAEGLRASDWGRALPSLVSAVDHDDDLRQAQLRFSQRRADQVREIFAAAIDRGDIPPDADTAVLAEMFAARFFFRKLLKGGRLDEAFVHEQVELVVRLAGLGH